MVTDYPSALFSTLREPTVNRVGLRASALVGLTRENPELDPLAALQLDNGLCIS